MIQPRVQAVMAFRSHTARPTGSPKVKTDTQGIDEHSAQFLSNCADGNELARSTYDTALTSLPTSPAVSRYTAANNLSCIVTENTMDGGTIIHNNGNCMAMNSLSPNNARRHITCDNRRVIDSNKTIVVTKEGASPKGKNSTHLR